MLVTADILYSDIVLAGTTRDLSTLLIDQRSGDMSKFSSNIDPIIQFISPF